MWLCVHFIFGLQAKSGVWVKCKMTAIRPIQKIIRIQFLKINKFNRFIYFFSIIYDRVYTYCSRGNFTTRIGILYNIMVVTLTTILHDSIISVYTSCGIYYFISDFQVTYIMSGVVSLIYVNN